MSKYSPLISLCLTLTTTREMLIVNIHLLGDIYSEEWNSSGKVQFCISFIDPKYAIIYKS